MSTTSETGKFATGLMDSKIGAWDGAQWVGNDDTRLDAKSASVIRSATSRPPDTVLSAVRRVVSV